MTAALKNLLDRLDAIAAKHAELGDTDVREQMYDAIYRGFIVRSPGYSTPAEFGMFSPTGDAAVHAALDEFIHSASRAGLATPAERFRAFQYAAVLSKLGSCYSTYFGHADHFDALQVAMSGAPLLPSPHRSVHIGDSETPVLARSWLMCLAVSPMLLFLIVVMPLGIDRWTTTRIILAVAIEVLCFAILVALWSPARISRIGFRIAAFIVFAGYTAYVIAEFAGDKPLQFSGSRAEASPFNAILGFILIGLPSLAYALLGRVSFRKPPAALDDEWDCEEPDASQDEGPQRRQ